ncbi:MAG TPA: hypothetical protein VKR32_08055 [Puia sp.]|nr:hypothetical protein [Puia sp.]
MIKKDGLILLKNNFNQVEKKFIDFFKSGKPRWPLEEHDFLRNHYSTIDNFFESNITLDKLKVNGLPESILHEVRLAFEAFKRGEEYK